MQIRILSNFQDLPTKMIMMADSLRPEAAKFPNFSLSPTPKDYGSTVCFYFSEVQFRN